MNLTFNQKPIKSNHVFNAAALLPAIFGAVCVLFLVYVFWWPFKDAYEVHRPLDHAVTYDTGTASIRIHRFYCSNLEIPITISRDLISIPQPNKPQLRISLPQTVQVYEIGCHAIDRIFDIPKSVPAGNYRLVNIATWEANPFRAGSVKLPELYLAIPAR